jgi:hypothetical protein
VNRHEAHWVRLRGYHFTLQAEIENLVHHGLDVQLVFWGRWQPVYLLLHGARLHVG